MVGSAPIGYNFARWVIERFGTLDALVPAMFVSRGVIYLRRLLYKGMDLSEQGDALEKVRTQTSRKQNMFGVV